METFQLSLASKTPTKGTAWHLLDGCLFRKA